MEREIRKYVRETLLWGYAETMEIGQETSFVSGQLKVSMNCLKKGIFVVTYEPKIPNEFGHKDKHLWNSKTNIWEKL
jgi:hypothetical protein